MGLLSRRKGRAFEQKIARILRATWPDRVVHRSSQADRAYASDVVVNEVPIWWECQDAAKPTPRDKLVQAERDSKGTFYKPMVVWHRSGERGLNVTMRVSTFLRLLVDEWDSSLNVEPDNLYLDAVTMDFKEVLDLLKEIYP